MIDPNNLKQIRLYADGELSPADAADFERRLLADPGFRRGVDALVQVERAMKSSLADAFADVSAPPVLRSRIQHAIAAAPQRSVLARLFAAPQHASVLAVAATVVLVAGVILFSIFGRTIDEVGGSAEAALVSNAAISFDQQHGRCAADRDGKLEYITPEDAERELTKLLGLRVKVPDLQAVGYEFCGAGPCAVEVLGSVAVAHLLYRRSPPASASPYTRQPLVSVFVIPNTGACCELARGLLPMKWEVVDVQKCRRTVLRASDCKVVYFMVCCSKGDAPAVAQLATSQTGAP